MCDMEERKPKSIYICYMCHTTYVLHLRIAKGLNAKTFLLVFRQFPARRSLPTKLIFPLISLPQMNCGP